MRKSVSVELPEIEAIQDDPKELILEYLKDNDFIVAPIADRLLGGKPKRVAYWLSLLEDEGILSHEKKLIKMKGDSQFRSMRVWRLVNLSSNKKGKT